MGSRLRPGAGAGSDQRGRGFQTRSKGFLCLSHANGAHGAAGGGGLTVLVVHQLFVPGADACFELFLGKNDTKNSGTAEITFTTNRSVARHDLFGCCDVSVLHCGKAQIHAYDNRPQPHSEGTSAGH